MAIPTLLEGRKLSTQYTNTKSNIQGPFEKFVDWLQCANVMQWVTVMPDGPHM